MKTPPFALGCPRCPAEYTVCPEDPDSTVSEVDNHLRYGCTGVEYPDDDQVRQLLAQVLEIPDVEMSRR